MNKRTERFRPDWDEFYKTEYKRNLLSNHKWIDKANALIDSAALLEQKVIEFWESWRSHLQDNSIRIKSDKYIGIYFMLISYAIENFLKSLIVRERKDEFENTLKKRCELPKILKNHNLVKLAQEARFPIKSQLQEDILRRLTRSVTWDGRYPLSLNYKNSRTAKFLDGKEYTISLYREIDVSLIKTLVKEIRQFIKMDSKTKYAP